jgi:hypothetical protein
MAYEFTEKGAFKRRGYGGVLTLSNGSGGTAGPTPEGGVLARHTQSMLFLPHRQSPVKELAGATGLPPQGCRPRTAKRVAFDFAVGAKLAASCCCWRLPSSA